MAIKTKSFSNLSASLHDVYSPVLSFIHYYSNAERVVLHNQYTLRKKGTNAVIGAVPFQKVNFCPF